MIEVEIKVKGASQTVTCENKFFDRDCTYAVLDISYEVGKIVLQMVKDAEVSEKGE